jgi:hypothetical protein
MIKLFGRTNRELPRIWLSLLPPASTETEPQKTVEALPPKTAIDITPAVGLYGPLVHDLPNPIHISVGSTILPDAAEDSAAHQIQADLVQALSCMRGRQPEFVSLALKQPLSETTLTGVFSALESAKTDELFKHLCLSVDGDPKGLFGMWRIHDGFEMIFLPHSRGEKEALSLFQIEAAKKRVAICTYRPLTWGTGCPLCLLPSVKEAAHESFMSPAAGLIADSCRAEGVMVGVRNWEEVEAAICSPVESPHAAAVGEAAVKAWKNPDEWRGLIDHPLPWVAKAASERAAL